MTCFVACFGGWKHERKEVAQRIAFYNRGWYIAKELMESAFVKSSTRRGHWFIVGPEEIHQLEDA